jgi:hypothetical protein
MSDNFVQLISGRTYMDTLRQERVVLKWVIVGEDGKTSAIVHPEGEPDMQSCYGMNLHRLAHVEE